MKLSPEILERFVIRVPDGRCLGRFTIQGPIMPVPPQFAHTFTDEEEATRHLHHARTGLGFPEAELARLKDVLEPQ